MNKQIDIAIKTKIISMKNYTSCTWPEIANECGVSVS